MGVGLNMANLKALPGGQGGAVKVSGSEPYGLTAEYERALVYLVCTDREVYSRIGALLDPKAIADADCGRMLKAAQAIAEDLGEGPSSYLTVIQRLKTWREEGKATHEHVLAAVDFFDEMSGAKLPAANEVVAEVASILKRRALQESTQKAIKAMAGQGDMASVAKAMLQAERIGETRQTLGETITDDTIDEIVAANKAAKFPTGCDELDTLLGGGLPEGYTLFLGREKSGKSMVLASIAAEAFFRGRAVAVATLELAAKKQIERIVANLTGCSLYDVQDGTANVRSRMAALKPQLGLLAVQFFAPDTPVNEITSWIEKLADKWGKKPELLAVDYADLVGAGKVGKDANGYTDAKVVGNALRNHALTHGYVTISAAQGKRGSGTNGKPLDMDDGADSQHKVRIADLVIAMRMEQDVKDQVDWTVVGARDGNDRISTGPLPTYKAQARMFPIAREVPW